MRAKKSKQPYRITVVFENGMIRNVWVKAVSREVAEQRALKFNRGAVGVKRGG